MKVLVTGGAGYIGSQTAKALATAGDEPVVVDDLRTGHRGNVRWGPFVEASIAETDRIREVIRRERIEAVVHFAASAYVGESMRDPRAYFRNNIDGTLSLLDAMLAEGVGSIVFSSTCATYGIPDRVPITEDEKQVPGESLRREQAVRREGPALVRRGVRTALGCASLLQRRGRGSRLARWARTTRPRHTSSR